MNYSSSLPASDIISRSSLGDEHLTNLVCNYVRAFGDSWAQLIKMTSSNKFRNNRPMAPLNDENERITVSAWEKSLKICNPMLSLTDNISLSEDGRSVVVQFSVEVDDTHGVTQTAIIMLALDSLMSLLASSAHASVESDKEASSFTMKIPSTASGEELLNNKGFPVGLCGPFKRWSLNFKSATMGGKGGMAGIAAVVISDVDKNKGFDTSGTDIIERMHCVTSATQQLDDSEMVRTLNINRRTESGSRYSVNSTRHTNHKDMQYQQTLYDKAAKEEKKQQKSQVISSELKGFFETCEREEDDSEENEEEEEEEEDAEDINKEEKEEDNATTDAAHIDNGTLIGARATLKRSRCKRECSVNLQTFIHKFIGTAKKNASKGRQQTTYCYPPPSDTFTSLFMQASESDAFYQTCQSLRGASRLKSVLGKYAGRQHDRKHGGNHQDGLYIRTEEGWEWTSPENRRLVIVFPDGSELVVLFKISCIRSEYFDKVSNTSAAAKNWMRVTVQLLRELKGIEAFMPLMGPSASAIQPNLIKTLVVVLNIRQTIGFRIPDHSKDWLPERRNTPLSSMGITSDRYDRIIEVMDLLMAGGTFVSACLNNAYFYERGIIPKSVSTMHKRQRQSWLHLDAMRLASIVLKYVHKARGMQHQTTAIASTPPTRQSIGSAITSQIQNFSDLSCCMRKREIQNYVSEDGKADIDYRISNAGAFKALVESTVAAIAAEGSPPPIKKRMFCSEDNNGEDEDSLERSGSRQKSAVLTALVLTRQSIDNAISIKGILR